MKHSVILANDAQFGNFCWPSVARLKDGRLVTVSSGHRLAHVCPYGKVVACVSEDDGKTWSEPITLIDTPLDDRDAGITPWEDGFLVTTFNNTREFQLKHIHKRPIPAEHERLIRERVAQVSDRDEEENFGSSVWYFDKNLKPVFHAMVSVSSPHGPTVLRDGRIFYVGRDAAHSCVDHSSSIDSIAVIESRDGKEWSEPRWIVTTEELQKEYPNCDPCEPHAIELRDGTILVQIRMEPLGDSKHFFLVQCVSHDGGKTFDAPQPLCIPDRPMYGSPPHLLELSDGTVVTAYSYRLAPFGQRARISRDGGKTWSREIMLRDDGPSWDLGYPATVECENGDLLTVYYQIPQGKENRAILATRWNPSDLF